VLNLIRYEQKLSLLRAPTPQPRTTLEKTNDTANGPERRQNLAEALAAKLSGLAAPMAPVLLPSLPDTIFLHQVLRHTAWDGVRWQSSPALSEAVAEVAIPIGQIDNLANRSQPPLVINFLRAGHLLAAGGPGTGKTALLRTLALAIAQTFTPAQAHLYLLNFAGRGLEPLAGLPHVGALINNAEPERLARLLTRLAQLVEERRFALAQANADDLAAYNLRASQRGLPVLPATFVLVDNVLELRQALADEFEVFLRLLRDGRTLGLYFALTAPTTALPYALLSQIEQRLTFRLPDAGDYLLFFKSLGPRALSNSIGSAFFSGSPPLHCQIAMPATHMPEADGSGLNSPTDSDFGATVEAMRLAWANQAGPMPILNLPDVVAFSALPTAPEKAITAGIETAIGLESISLRARHLRWADEGTHFLVTGPVASGKSSLLRTLLLSAASRYSSAELAMLLVDFSRESLRPLRRLPHVLAYVDDEESLFTQLTHLQAELAWRRGQLAALATKAEEDEQLAANRRYDFPPLVVAFDDYDQVQDALGGVGHDIFEELGRVLRRESRLALHVLLSSETASANRAGDALLRALRLNRAGISLVNADGVESLGGRVTAAMRKTDLPAGRGYQVLRNTTQVVQFAHVVSPLALVRDIASRWSARAKWPHPAEGVPLPAPPVSQRLGLELDFDFDFDGALTDYRQQQGYEQH
jgi:DNA segregation ATPase FtsK/SpoIIIE, S-DNA-T family